LDLEFSDFSGRGVFWHLGLLLGIPASRLKPAAAEEDKATIKRSASVGAGLRRGAASVALSCGGLVYALRSNINSAPSPICFNHTCETLL
jgi:hypothetical protein